MADPSFCPETLPDAVLADSCCHQVLMIQCALFTRASFDPPRQPWKETEK